VTPRAWWPAAAALLAACAATLHNYTDPRGPRYAGGDAVAPQPRRDTLKIVVFNVQYAIHVGRAIRLIRETDALRDPDVLLLQEMDEPGARTIADSLGLNYVYYPATVSPVTHRDFGDAVLTPYPIEADRKVILPHLGRTRRTQREAVAATILVGGRALRVYSVHLATMIELGPHARREQLAAVLADARRYPLVVIGGDFNSGSVADIAPPEDFAWPTRHLGRTEGFWDLDHVLLKGLVPAGSPDAGLVRDVHGASDHRPVWTLARLPAGGTGP
jgi:endonuclease/exonuclease/phosphatase family metal-dependent hydrolase